MRCPICCVLLAAVCTLSGCGSSNPRDFEMPEADPTVATNAYDAGTVETFEGQIVGIDRVDIDPGPGERPALVVRFIGNGQFPRIYLGPDDHVNSGDMDLRILDYVEVTASRVTTVPGLEFVASSLKSGENSVTLRNTNGRPYWNERGAYNSNPGGVIRTLPMDDQDVSEFDQLRDQVNVIQSRRSSR